jgi:2-hydroxy-3-oxopropionate reductase
MRIAFIGLGIMGSPMACNLVRAGHEVAGFTRTASKGAALVAAGGEIASSSADAVSGAEAVITMLPDSPDVLDVLLAGEDALLAMAQPGALVIDMSTIKPAAAREVAASAACRGLRPLDAPVSGGEQGAIDGTLSIMVGGDEPVFEVARPLLHAMGSTVVHVGPAGAGQTVKAANQLIVAGIIELVAEALVFIDAHGVDSERAVEVLADGLAGNTVLDRKASTMLAREFAPGFRVDLHHKDLGIVLEAAREVGVAIPLGATVAVLMAALRSQGDGSLDHSALLRGVERLSGRPTG